MQIALNAHGNAALTRQRLHSVTVIEMFLGPCVVVCCLFTTAQLFEPSFDARHVILALIALLMTFPGSLRFADPPWRMARKTFVDWMVVALVLILFGEVTDYMRYFSRAFLAGWLVATPVILLATGEAVRRLLPKLIDNGYRRSAVIVGDNAVGAALALRFAENSYLGERFVGFFDDRSAERLPPPSDGKLLGPISRLAGYVKQHHIEHIYIALPMASQPRIQALLDDIKDTTASIFFIPDIFITDMMQGHIDSFSGMPVVAVRDTPFTGISAIAKRISDIVLGTLILLLCAPLMAAVALGVRLSSPGPVMFAQRRYGLDGREIIVYKFRSMTVTEDGDRRYVQVTRGDARVTRFGAFIRKTSLDELPQFINVLQGRMSIVGPRPHAIAVNEQYRKLIPGYMIRHKVKPGITGWAQVNGFRGGDDLNHMKMRVRYDLEYLRNWSLPLDLSIILKTVLIVTRDSRAY